MSGRDKQLLIDLIENQVLYDYSSVDIEDLIELLPLDHLEAIDHFCKKFDMGDWFYDAIALNDINISDELEVMSVNRREEEQIAERDQAMAELDYKLSQGWNG